MGGCIGKASGQTSPATPQRHGHAEPRRRVPAQSTSYADADPGLAALASRRRGTASSSAPPTGTQLSASPTASAANASSLLAPQKKELLPREQPESSATASIRSHTPPTSPGRLRSRHIRVASSTAGSLQPLAALPTALSESPQTEFLKARAAVMEWLQLPEAQLKEIINSQDDKGDTALHKLVKFTSLRYLRSDDVCKDAPDLIRSLLEKGANPYLINHEGKTPAEYVDRYTHIVLAPRVGYELAHAGPLNQQRLEDNRAAFAEDPVKAQALADARRQVRDTFRAVGGMFDKGPNQLKPYLVGDVVRFASGQATPGLSNSVPFFGPAEHAQYSLFDVDGRVSEHVTRGRRGLGRPEGNNLVLRFESDDVGRPVLKGLVFPSKLKKEDRKWADSSARRQPHTTAYGGGTFAFAGDISTNAEGKITSISNWSGHNRPKPVLLAAVTLYLQSQRLLTEDFKMAIAWEHLGEEQYKGPVALAKARELIAQRLPEINTEARAGLRQQVAGLEKKLRDLGNTSEPAHGAGRSHFSQQRAQAYSKLKQAEAEAQFLEQIGYDPSTQAVDAHKVPRGSYRQAPATVPFS